MTKVKQGISGFPRTCGGDPRLMRLNGSNRKFSPHLRG